MARARSPFSFRPRCSPMQLQFSLTNPGVEFFLAGVSVCFYLCAVVDFHRPEKMFKTQIS